MSHSLYDRRPLAPLCRRFLTTALFAVAAFAFVAASARDASAQTTGSPDLVISQVYTRGGEPGATYRNDFVEIFNRGDVTVNLRDYTLMATVNAPPPPGSPGGLISLA